MLVIQSGVHNLFDTEASQRDAEDRRVTQREALHVFYDLAEDEDVAVQVLHFEFPGAVGLLS